MKSENIVMFIAIGFAPCPDYMRAPRRGKGGEVAAQKYRATAGVEKNPRSPSLQESVA
jgi:hypothetical protein